MKKITTLLLSTALAGTIGATAIAPAAYADDRGPGFRERGEQGEHMQRGGKMRGGERGSGGGLMLARVMCDEEGAARLEKMFERVESRLNLTDEQKPLFEDLKGTALMAQTGYADTCTTPVKGGDSDFIDRLKAQQTNAAARLTAMSEVMPSLEAFYDSLTDEQKAGLMPKMGQRKGDGFERGEHRGGDHGPRRG